MQRNIRDIFRRKKSNRVAPKAPLTTRQLLKKLWKIFAIIMGVFLLFFILIYNGIIGYMPDIEELKNPRDQYASIIYSADEKEIGRYYEGMGNRVYADFDEISPHVVDALIATEDARFREHSGVDGRAMGRVLFKTLLMGRKNAGGGSTLTQQLAKQLYSPSSSNFLSRAMKKPIEWMIAVKLERFYSKDEIVKMYLNQFDFLYNAVGIKSAAHVYFGKNPKDLNIQEAATLIGMVKNPSYYNPVRNNERTRMRRNVVFEQMMKSGMLTQAEVDSLSELPLELDFHHVDRQDDGMAPYFRVELQRMMNAKKPDPDRYHSWERAAYLRDSALWEDNPLYGWIEKNPKPDGSKYDLYNDGLRIHTTIDTRMQKYAEEAVREHMGGTLQPAFWAENRGSSTMPYSRDRSELSEIRYNRLIRNAMRQTDRYRTMKAGGASEAQIKAAFDTKREMKVFTYRGIRDTVMTPLDSLKYMKSFLRCGFVAIDPINGQVKAYVGGPDFNSFQYDMVSIGRRQIGSTVKPFLYAKAMDEGKTPCDTYLNTQPIFNLPGGGRWAPRSGRSRVGQMVNLRWALTASSNWISARLIDELGPQSLINMMRTFHITSPMEPILPLSLGISEVSVMEMAAAYTAFANRGVYMQPQMVTSITDSKGAIIAEFLPAHNQVLTEEGYYRILSLLLNVVDQGTARRLRSAYNLSGQIGGKTGTTNYNADGWFMGFTPQIVTATWVGGDEKYIHFNNMAYGQGASMALPIFGRFMKKLYNDKKLPYTQDASFLFPDDINLCSSGDYGFYSGESSHSSSSSASEESASEAVAVETSMDDVF